MPAAVAMTLSADKQELMRSFLIPGYYFQKVAEKEKDPDIKEDIRHKSQDLLSILRDRTGVLSRCSNMEIACMERRARECVGLLFEKARWNHSRGAILRKQTERYI